ncbi:MAG: serine/threonine-protein kinase [Polyangiaceae bacterium]
MGEGTPTGDKLTTTTATAARGAQAELGEKLGRAHAARIARLAPLPAIGWLSALGIDLAFGSVVYPGHEHTVLVIRLVVGAVLLPVTFVIRRRAPASGPALDAIVAGIVFVLAGALGVIGCFSGGFQSIHAGGAIIVMAVPSFLELPARRGARIPAAGLVSYAAATIATTPLVGDPATSLASTRNIVGLAGQLFLMGLMGGLGVLGGHLSHQLRMQVYETRSIGRYKLKKLLGKGGMGEVWAAYHDGLKRDVALKILRDAGERTAKRFEREVRVLADLRHPNTVRVFDYGVTDDGLLYYAMELLEGVDLGTLVRREGALPPARAAYLVEHAARALGEAHKKGIVHRDVKPENLFVASAGGEADFVKVLDFGIVRIERDDAETLTQEGQFAGTPLFMAPEVGAGEEATAQSDVYALGAVFYYLLTGAPVFQVKGVAAVLRAHREEPVVPPSLRMSVPLDPAVETIVLRCLAKLPSERPADATDVATALQATGLSATWQPDTTPVTVGSTPFEPSRDSLAATPEQMTRPLRKR